MNKVTVHCGVPECNGTFNSWEDFEEHYKQEHIKSYGPFMFGCHPKIVYSEFTTNSEESK